LGQFRHDSVNQGGGDSQETLVSGMEWKNSHVSTKGNKTNLNAINEFSGKTLATGRNIKNTSS
jgi:hypothetical protein